MEEGGGVKDGGARRDGGGRRSRGGESLGALRRLSWTDRVVRGFMATTFSAAPAGPSPLPSANAPPTPRRARAPDPSRDMRPLTDDETRLVFEKLKKCAAAPQSAVGRAEVAAGAAANTNQASLAGLGDGSDAMDLRDSGDSDPSYRHLLALFHSVGAGACLTAPPARDGRTMEPTLFRVVVACAFRCSFLGRERGGACFSTGLRCRRHPQLSASPSLAPCDSRCVPCACGSCVCEQRASCTAQHVEAKIERTAVIPDEAPTALRTELCFAVERSCSFFEAACASAHQTGGGRAAGR